MFFVENEGKNSEMAHEILKRMDRRTLGDSIATDMANLGNVSSNWNCTMPQFQNRQQRVNDDDKDDQSSDEKSDQVSDNDSTEQNTQGLFR